MTTRPGPAQSYRHRAKPPPFSPPPQRNRTNQAPSPDGSNRKASLPSPPRAPAACCRRKEKVAASRHRAHWPSPRHEPRERIRCPRRAGPTPPHPTDWRPPRMGAALLAAPSIKGAGGSVRVPRNETEASIPPAVKVKSPFLPPRLPPAPTLLLLLRFSNRRTAMHLATSPQERPSVGFVPDPQASKSPEVKPRTQRRHGRAWRRPHRARRVKPRRRPVTDRERGIDVVRTSSSPLHTPARAFLPAPSDDCFSSLPIACVPSARQIAWPFHLFSPTN